MPLHRLLIVDDNPADVDLILEGCEERRLELDIAVVADGELALDYLHRRAPFESAEPPHAIVLDLNLPKLTGVEVLNEMHRHAELAAIPVIVLTSSGRDRDSKRLAGYGVRYIQKSLEAATFLPGLVDAIEQALRDTPVADGN